MSDLLETLKGWLLAVLVVLSVVLSVGLWNNAPVFETIDNGGYIPNPAFGLKKTVEQVLLPTQVEARISDKRSVLLLPFTDQYDKAWDELRKLAVRELSVVGDPDTVMQAIQTNVHVTYRFGINLNEEQVYQIIRIVDSSLFRMEINSVVVYKDTAGIGRIVLMDGDGPIFQGLIGGGSPLFDAFPQWGGLPAYTVHHSDRGSFYVPAEKIKVPMGTYERNSIPSETLARSFFVDPNLTRKIKERDGSLILTDGNRTVQIASQSKSIRYTSTLPPERKTEQAGKDSSFQRGVAFINEHGGLQGPYIGKLQSGWGVDRREYEFVEYRNGWPIFTGMNGIRISLAGNEVTEMNRNTLLLGTEVKQEIVEIDPPAKLLAPGIRNLYLAYSPRTVESNKIQLLPVWVVEKPTGPPDTYNAITGAIWQDTGEWLHGLE